MRVVFFLRGRTVPSSRARGATIAQALGAAGLSCDVRAAVPSVDGDSWLPRWCKWLGPLFIPVAAMAQLRATRGLVAGDVVFFQRPLTELPTWALEARIARRHPTILDFDDAIHLTWQNRRKLPALVRMVDQVIVGNRTLAEVTDAPDKTTVIPTAIDTTRYRPLPPSARQGRDVVVGWTGLSRNYPQLMVAHAPLQRALKETGARLLVISDRPPPPSLGAEFIPWRADRELDDLARIDIGLMPLPDTPYARGKCAYKLLQYMALARPGVASPVGANAEAVTDERDGFLPGDAGAFTDVLVRLIRDPDLRARVGQAARARVETAYSLAAVLPRYLDVMSRLGVAS